MIRQYDMSSCWKAFRSCCCYLCGALKEHSLSNSGQRDGQTLMVRRDNKVEAHQWSAAEGRWIKIGDVTGGQGGGASAGKKMFKGKVSTLTYYSSYNDYNYFLLDFSVSQWSFVYFQEYDYVFDVELDEGKAPLKLPFNAGDDPWMAAHNFLQDNDMSPMFLDQVRITNIYPIYYLHPCCNVLRAQIVDANYKPTFNFTYITSPLPTYLHLYLPTFTFTYLPSPLPTYLCLYLYPCAF